MTPKKVRSVKSQNYKTIKNSFQGIKFNLLARQSGFKKRKEKKLTGEVLLITFLMMALKGKNTFQSWAEIIGIHIKKNVSRQGIWKRMNSFFVKFVYRVLSSVFSEQLKYIQSRVRDSEKLKRYKRILIQDSTIIRLPSWLAWCYPGNYSNGEIKALIKIQIVFELISNKIIRFEITPYCKNDQSMSKMILPIAKKDDLIIRDMGYFVLEDFESMTESGASYLTRLKPGVKIYDTTSGKEINLLKILKRDGELDRWVLVGAEKQVKIRIVAQKLPDEIVNEKIRKAKNNRDKRLNHTKEYYELLRYNIYLTNIPYSELSTTRISKTYALRWRIETIFKSWKSYLNLQKLIPDNVKMTKERVEAVLYMMMILIMKFQIKIFNTILEYLGQQKMNIEISLLKLTDMLSQLFEDLISMKKMELIEFVLQHCKYDKRNDRRNYYQNPILS